MIFKSNDEKIFEARLQSNLYIIKFDIILEKALANSAAIKEWHRRLRHMPIEKIEKIENLKKNNIVQDLDIHTTTKFSCEDCAQGKIHRCSHPSKTSLKADKPGISIHFDTIGPIKPMSLGGSKYFLLAKDEYSRYRIVKFISSKDLIKDEVMKIISKAEYETKNNVLRIVSDNGTEFCNQNLKKFLDDRGMVHDLSAVYVPQQNGFVKREVRTVTEMARSILVASKIDKSLWPEAINTAVYVLNRTAISLENRRERDWIDRENGSDDPSIIKTDTKVVG